MFSSYRRIKRHCFDRTFRFASLFCRSFVFIVRVCPDSSVGSHSFQFIVLPLVQGIMDRKWMSANRMSKEYVVGVDYFVKCVVECLGTSSNIKCPCLSCYVKSVNAEELVAHLKGYGIDQTYIDSVQGHFNNHSDLVEVYNSVCKIIGGFEISKTKWISIVCPRQPNNDDCGYYVMKFMKKIITHNEMIIPKEFFSDCQMYIYSPAQLDELRGEWCCYVYKYL